LGLSAFFHEGKRGGKRAILDWGQSLRSSETMDGREKKKEKKTPLYFVTADRKVSTLTFLYLTAQKRDFASSGKRGAPHLIFSARLRGCKGGKRKKGKEKNSFFLSFYSPLLEREKREYSLHSRSIGLKPIWGKKEV